jgi:hypothetical protein
LSVHRAVTFVSDLPRSRTAKIERGTRLIADDPGVVCRWDQPSEIKHTRGLLESLGEDPDLALGIRRSEAAVSHRRRLQFSDVGTGGPCPVM